MDNTKSDEFNDGVGIEVIDHIVIRDKETGEILIDMRGNNNVKRISTD